jgi:hypothetical protein
MMENPEQYVTEYGSFILFTYEKVTSIITIVKT